MCDEQRIYSLPPGAEVAIMPADATSPADVLGIGKIEVVGPMLVRLSDGAVYDAIDGKGLIRRGYITPSTAAHRLAIIRREHRERLKRTQTRLQVAG
jgi:hypothetical protein